VAASMLPFMHGHLVCELLTQYTVLLMLILTIGRASLYSRSAHRNLTSRYRYLGLRCSQSHLTISQRRRNEERIQQDQDDNICVDAVTNDSTPYLQEAPDVTDNQEASVAKENQQSSRLHKDLSIVQKLQAHYGERELFVSEEDSGRLSSLLRKFMREVSAPVTVITVAHEDPVSDEHVPLGTVVSSLNTVTLDPPHISFNIKTPSQTLEAIRAAEGNFRVHFLTATPQGGRTASAFSKKNDRESWSHRMDQGNITQPPTSAHISARAPEISGKALFAAMACQVSQVIPVADHVVVVAKVKNLDTSGLTSYPQGLLMYHNGNYTSSESAIVWVPNQGKHPEF
jgi:flavin reductase (DIM6/NTAB) family NADH-FMN oxidoreductase RutF